MSIVARIRTKFERAIKYGAILARESGPVDAGRWLAASILGKKTTVPVTIGGTRVNIRTFSSDLDAATVSLRGELNSLFKAVPKLEHGFIVDGGGYIGTAAIEFAKAYPEATVVTLEPSQDNFALLKRNVAAYPNIHPVNAALSNHSGKIELRNRGTGEWGFTIVERPDDHPDSRVLHEVDCVTIPELMERFGKGGVDILKLDIEGGEYQLLKDKPEWISDVGVVCIELHDRIVGGCSEAFRNATEGRDNRDMDGEKYLSFRRDRAAA